MFETSPGCLTLLPEMENLPVILVIGEGMAAQQQIWGRPRSALMHCWPPPEVCRRQQWNWLTARALCTPKWPAITPGKAGQFATDRTSLWLYKTRGTLTLFRFYCKAVKITHCYSCLKTYELGISVTFKMCYSLSYYWIIRQIWLPLRGLNFQSIKVILAICYF